MPVEESVLLLVTFGKWVCQAKVSALENLLDGFRVGVGSWAERCPGG